jgi:hypothetical protein
MAWTPPDVSQSYPFIGATEGTFLLIYPRVFTLTIPVDASSLYIYLQISI